MSILTDDERPKLPRAAVDEHNLHGGRMLYTSEQMRAYADAREAAALAKLAQQEPRPKKDQRITLHWQGRVDGTNEGFEINGMLGIPDSEGVTYITAAQAAEFFGFAAPEAPKGDNAR